MVFGRPIGTFAVLTSFRAAKEPSCLLKNTRQKILRPQGKEKGKRQAAPRLVVI